MKKNVSMQIINANAAGIDVGSRSHFVAIGQGKADVKEFGVYNEDLQAIAQWLLASDVKTVAMESTGTYWQSLFAVLQNAGLQVDFARMGGDYQRSLVRHNEFGGLVTTKAYYRVPASQRHNLGFGITTEWLDPSDIKGDILFSFHTHWARNNQLFYVDNNADILHGVDMLKGSPIRTVYRPSGDDIRAALTLKWSGILSDRSGIYQYNGAGAISPLQSTSLLRYNFIYWPW